MKFARPFVSASCFMCCIATVATLVEMLCVSRMTPCSVYVGAFRSWQKLPSVLLLTKTCFNYSGIPHSLSYHRTLLRLLSCSWLCACFPVLQCFECSHKKARAWDCTSSAWHPTVPGIQQCGQPTVRAYTISMINFRKASM